uniref:Splicing factor Cactin n=1 Tax=Plectus sambesii TaxID=2011161 RepID=A0A914XFH7_9BILA
MGRSRSRSGSRSRHRSSKKKRESRSPVNDRDRRRSRSRSPKAGGSKSRKSDRRGRSSSDDDGLQKRLEVERGEKKRQKQQEKEKAKETETPEEKRARRLAKKLIKEQKRKDKLGWGEEHLGYTNFDNPFGDSTLTDTFVWGKKLEKEGKTDVPLTQLERSAKERVVKNYTELEKLKMQREAREAARADMEMMQRESEVVQHKEWVRQEDKFHLQQAKLRSQLRIKEKRAKAIDLLAKYINAEDDDEDIDIDITEPYNFLMGLTMRDLEDLLEDIKVYRSLEGDKNGDYWKDIRTITEDELAKMRRMDPNSSEYVGDRARDAIHDSVQRDVNRIFKGKNHRELALLETEIMKKVRMQQEGVDVAYWESLLGHLKAHMAKARLRERHQETLRLKLAKLKSEQLAEVNQVVESPAASTSAAAAVAASVAPVALLTGEDDEERDKQWSEMSPEERAEATIAMFKAGSYSPAYQADGDVQPGVEVIDEAEDAKRRQFNLVEMKTTGTTLSQREAQFEAEARKGMSKEEATFAVEAPIEAQSYLWSDKYRPRKPRYFNRVHTGFEWNKYNQTHYDLDNPPPKIVQGY